MMKTRNGVSGRGLLFDLFDGVGRRRHPATVTLLVPLLLFVISCATPSHRGDRPTADTQPGMSAVQQKYSRIILGYREFSPEERTPQLIYFCYLLRSIYESKTTAPDDVWPGIRDAVGPPIVDLLQSDEETREEVFYVGPAVKMIPPLHLTSAIPILREMLDSRDVYLCRLAIEALGQMGDTESIPAIRKRLEPKSRPGRFGGGDDMTTPQYAAAALWKMGDAEARRILAEHLVHPAQSVRVQAAIAFAEMGDATGIRVLESRLQNPGAFRIPVLDALSHLDHPRATELLEREMNVGDMRGRLLAALYLAEQGSSTARQFLLKTARGSDLNNAYSAAVHLARLKDRNAVSLLEALSFRVDPEQSLAAAAALAWMGSPFGYEELIRTLESEEWSYRAIAAAMLLLLEQGPTKAG